MRFDVYLVNGFVIRPPLGHSLLWICKLLTWDYFLLS